MTDPAWKKHLAKGKPKTAIYRLRGCGGCDDAILDLNETLLKYADLAEIVLWPMAMECDTSRIQQMKDGEIALSIIHGTVCNTAHEEAARLLRAKSQFVLALGSCACFGGMGRLADLRSRKNMLKRKRQAAPAIAAPAGDSAWSEIRSGLRLLGPEADRPQTERVYPLSEVIRVDYFLPGCPPPGSLVAEVFSAGLENKLPKRGTTLGPSKALCSVCPRNRSKPARMEISQFRRIHEIEANESCFLAQGILCLGPVVRSGCGETCIRVNVPCRGCFGPAEGVRDTGLDFLSGLASLISAETEEDVHNTLEALVDLSGYCYRYNPPSPGIGKQQGGIDDAKNRHPSDTQARRAREDRTVS